MADKRFAPESSRSKGTVNDSNTVHIRQLTDEQLAHYRATGELPASTDIPLVEVTDVSSHQPPPGTGYFNGVKKK